MGMTNRCTGFFTSLRSVKTSERVPQNSQGIWERRQSRCQADLAETRSSQGDYHLHRWWFWRTFGGFQGIHGMRILPGTHILLWHTTDNPLLGIEHSRMIEDPSDTIFVSLWEMAIKMSIGKLAVSRPLSRIIPNEISTQPPEGEGFGISSQRSFWQDDHFTGDDREHGGDEQGSSFWVVRYCSDLTFLAISEEYYRAYLFGIKWNQTRPPGKLCGVQRTAWWIVWSYLCQGNKLGYAFFSIVSVQ